VARGINSIIGTGQKNCQLCSRHVFREEYWKLEDGEFLFETFFPQGRLLNCVTGGDTVSTEAVATRRHAGRHLPAIGWKTRIANSQLALAA
jgi:hypothetical protein